MRAKNWAVALVVTMVSALAVLPGSVTPAAAATTSVTSTLNCVAHAPIVGDQQVTQTVTITTDAPASVLSGHTFTLTAQTPVSQIAGSQSGGTVSNVTNISYKIPVPANASFVSASLSGGFNIGSGTPTITLQGSASAGNVIFSVPGPIPANQNYQLPAVTVTLLATGADFSTIALRMGGTSTSDPGFTTTANITSPISAAVATECYPAPPNPAWSTTTIVPPDTTPPTISLNTPAAGGQYPLGGNVAANYLCSDGQFGSGVATCAGTVPNGSPIDTSTLGTHSFTVTSTDNDGHVAVPVTNTYTVVPAGNDHTPPQVTISVPANGAVYQQNASVASSYSCLDTGSGIANCVGTVANGTAIDTATVGPHSFTVTAGDGEGNSFTVVNSYRVNPPAAQQNWTTGDVTNRMPVGCDTLFNAFHESIPTLANTAPALAGAGSQFAWSMTIDTDVVPTLNNGSNLIYRWKKPTNAHFVSAAFTGSGMNINGPTITIKPDGTLEITIASVVDQSILGFGDDSFRPPPFSAVIQVDGAPGTVVQNKFDYFQITTATVGIPTTQHCPAGDTFNNRVNVALTNTTVVDATPPVITIASPVHGQAYAAGTNLHFTYSCTDNVGTPTCVGDVPNNSTLDTSSSGSHQLHVTSTDAAGNTAAKYVSYSIADPTVSVGNASVVEGPGATLTFPITLSNPSSSTISVDYSTSDGTAIQPADYTNTVGTVTFAPGDPLTKNVSVPVNTAEYFAGARTLTLSAVTASHATIGSNGTGTGTIVGADPPQVVVANAAVTEGPGAKLDFAVSLPAQPDFPVAVSYQTANGTATSPGRYALTSGTLTFNPGGALVQHVLVNVVDDSLYNEGSSPLNTQTMSLQATETVNGYSSTGTGTITDNEVVPALINIGSATIREGDANARALKISVTLNKPSNSPVTVRYTTVAGPVASGNAAAGSDYKTKSGTLTFKANAVSASISLSIIGDATLEPDETFTVKLSNPGGALLGNDTGTVTILNDDGPSAAGVEATVSDAVSYEGGGGKTTKISFTISLNKRPSAPVTISYTTVSDTATAGSDFKAKTGSVTFKTTTVAKVVTISITADNADVGNEVFHLVLSGAPAGVTITDSSGNGTILNDD